LKTENIDNAKVDDIQDATSNSSANGSEECKPEPITKNLTLYTACTENVFSYLLIAPDLENRNGCKYLNSGSRLLNSHEKGMCNVGKSSKAIFWAIQENEKHLEDQRLPILLPVHDPVMMKISGCKDGNSPFYVEKLEDLDHEVIVLSHEAGNPTIILSSARNIYDDAYDYSERSFLSLGNTLEKSLAVLCKNLKYKLDSVREKCMLKGSNVNAKSPENETTQCIDENKSLPNLKRTLSDENLSYDSPTKKLKESLSLEIDWFNEDPYNAVALRYTTLNKDIKDVISDAETTWKRCRKFHSFKKLGNELTQWFMKAHSREVARMMSYEIITTMMAADIEYKEVAEKLNDYRDISREENGFNFVHKWPAVVETFLLQKLSETILLT
jgi:hypothetical protein